MLNKLKSPCECTKYLYLILIIALLLRLIGATHAFPFIFHPDEPSVVRSALGIRFDANPGHFDWPHLHFYLNYFVYFVFIKLRGLVQAIGLRSSIENLFPLLWRDPLIFYFISRIISAVMGALTVIPVYLAAKTLFNKKAGVFAALALAIMPFHVWHSHYNLIDVPMTFWISWAIYFSAQILKSPRTKNYILAGFFVGLAASTKYNGGLTALMIPLAHFFRVYRNNLSDNFSKSIVASFVVSLKTAFLKIRSVKDLVLSGMLSAFGFFIGTPYALLDYATFIRTDSPNGALWQFKNVGKVAFPTQLFQLGHNLIFKLSDDFGYTFLAIYLLLIFVLLWRFLKKKSMVDLHLWFLVLPSFFLLFYISGFVKTRSHYYFPVYPFVALIVGYVLARHSQISKSAKRFGMYTFIVAIFAIPTYLSLKNVLLFARPDTRNDLYVWMQNNVTSTDMLVYNSNSLNPVLEKFPDNIIKKSGHACKGVAGVKGYVLLHYSFEEYSRFHYNRFGCRLGSEIGIDSRVPYVGKPVFTLETTILPKNQTGPYIVVLKFDGTSSADL